MSSSSNKSPPTENSFWKLVHFEKTPYWLQDNEYIRNYYRVPMSVWDSLKSALFGLHNETMNIYTHLIGFFIFVGITWFTLSFLSSLLKQPLSLEQYIVSGTNPSLSSRLETYSLDAWSGFLGVLLETKKFFLGFLHFSCRLASSSYSLSAASVERYWSAFQDSSLFFRSFPFTLLDASWSHKLSPDRDSFVSQVFWKVIDEHKTALLFLLTGACVCLFCSTIFHMFFYVSESCFKSLSRLDYAGIVFLTMGHSLVGTYYTLYCMPELSRRYNIVISIAGLLTLGVTLYPAFDAPHNRLTRALVFVLFGTVSGLPILHAGWLHGFGHVEYMHHAQYMFIMATFYLLGAFFFVTRLPERCSPGKFDLFFNSHNLMHICVLIAALIHWYGCMQSCIYRLHQGCALSPILSQTFLSS
ncbi:Heptahelical transmembrane protein 4 [Galdieria sulphuraria]|nr:Heptahelical transmembrane protein 4 [Galdieria sulphuraria]